MSLNLFVKNNFLQDKNKIRHKKRWSQCMYMYYFLGYQLMDNIELTEQEKEVIFLDLVGFVTLWGSSNYHYSFL